VPKQSRWGMRLPRFARNDKKKEARNDKKEWLRITRGRGLAMVRRRGQDDTRFNSEEQKLSAVLSGS